jgi:hypothetical protein
MDRQTSTAAQAKLRAFLDAHLGTPQSEDVGALLGQAALLYDSPLAGEPMPGDWRDAISAALSDECPESAWLRPGRIAMHDDGEHRSRH